MVSETNTGRKKDRKSGDRLKWALEIPLNVKLVAKDTNNPLSSSLMNKCISYELHCKTILLSGLQGSETGR